MSIKVNGTAIPAAAGNIKYNGTNLTKVICNGTTVWQVVTEKWIVKNGVLQSGIATPTFSYQGHSMKTGAQNIYGSTPSYGITGHVNGNGGAWSMKTGAIDTNGASTLEITISSDTTGDAAYKYLYTKIYSGSTLIETKTASSTDVVNYVCWLSGTFTYSINISGHSSISIEMLTNNLASSNNWIRFGIVNAVLK